MKIFFCLITILTVWGASSSATFGQGRTRDFEVVGGRAKLIAPHKGDAEKATAIETFMSDWTELYAVAIDTSSVIGIRTDDTPLIIATEAGDPILQGRGVNMACVRGSRDAFVVFVTSRGDLIVAGGSARGTAFGLLHLSEMMGVSPTRDWDNKPTPHRAEHFRLPTHYTSTHWPAVEIRAIGVLGLDQTQTAIERTLLRLGLNAYFNQPGAPSSALISEDGDVTFRNSPTAEQETIIIEHIDGRETTATALTSNARGIYYTAAQDSATDCMQLRKALDAGANLVWALAPQKRRETLTTFATMCWHSRTIGAATKEATSKRRKGAK